VLWQDIENKELHIQWIQVVISPGVRRPDRKAKRSPQSRAKVRKSETLAPFFHTPSWHAQGEIYNFRLYKTEILFVSWFVYLITLFLSEGVGLRPLTCCDCVLESRRGHGCVSVVCVVCFWGLCDELITRPEESYRLWCFILCDLQTSRMRRS